MKFNLLVATLVALALLSAPADARTIHRRRLASGSGDHGGRLCRDAGPSPMSWKSILVAWHRSPNPTDDAVVKHRDARQRTIETFHGSEDREPENRRAVI